MELEDKYLNLMLYDHFGFGFGGNEIGRKTVSLKLVFIILSILLLLCIEEFLIPILLKLK